MVDRRCGWQEEEQQRSDEDSGDRNEFVHRMGCPLKIHFISSAEGGSD
jgi:hypothetical protein